jgi:hypothetical protein
MEHQWFVTDRYGTQSGPLDIATLRDRFNARSIDMATLVWREGLAEWVPLGSLAGDLGITAQPSPPPLPHAGPTIPPPLPHSGATMPPPVLQAGPPMPPPPPGPSFNPNTDARIPTGTAFSNSLADNITVLRAFVGPNFERYQQQWAALDRSQGHNAWNWSAFLFGFVWLAYRKMYMYSAIVIGSMFLLGVFEELLNLPNSLSNATSFGFAIAVGLLGNYLYRVHTRKKISELPSHLSKEETITAASQLGGTSVGAAIGAAVLIVFLIVVSVAATS